MISEEKIKEFRKSLAKGEPDGEVREKLIREGYSKEDIEKVFAPKPYDMRSWYLVFATILLLFGLYLMLKGNAGILILLFSALLFLQYYRETERVKKEQAK